MAAARALRAVLAALLLAGVGSAAGQGSAGWTADVIYVPTPPEVVDEMLRLARVRKGDVLYDLGSGDGRIAIAAARTYGIRATGIDIDPALIAEARDNAKKAGVEGRVTFRREDLFKADFRDATVVTLYLLPELNVRLRPRLLAELRPGARIVAHQFDMGDWPPEKTVEVQGRTLYFWTVPGTHKEEPSCPRKPC
jgi:ribosomal protein L11 methylase PrmA